LRHVFKTYCKCNKLQALLIVVIIILLSAHSGTAREGKFWELIRDLKYELLGKDKQPSNIEYKIQITANSARLNIKKIVADSVYLEEPIQEFKYKKEYKYITGSFDEYIDAKEYASVIERRSGIDNIIILAFENNKLIGIITIDPSIIIRSISSALSIISLSKLISINVISNEILASTVPSSRLKKFP